MLQIWLIVKGKIHNSTAIKGMETAGESGNYIGVRRKKSKQKKY